MSYILDALRRADAERERGAVPGLHAQPRPTGPAQVHASRRGWWAGAAAAALLVVALAAGGGWLWGGGAAREAMLPSTAVVPVAMAPAGPTAVSPQGATAAAVDPAAASPVPSRHEPVSQPPPTATRAAAPEPAAEPPEAEPAEPRRGARARSEPAEPARTPDSARAARAAAAANPAAASDERRVLAIDELPPEIRRSLPTLTVSGSIYSDDASSRFVMINGEAVREGGRITPELTLEQIQLKSAVLRYKGYRYRLPL